MQLRAAWAVLGLLSRAVSLALGRAAWLSSAVGSRTRRSAQQWRCSRRAGATVRVFAGDVASVEQLKAVFAEISLTMRPLSFVIHAAGVLDDGVLTEQNAERFARVMAPKVEGANILAGLLADRPDVELVLFSSIASLLGLPGQGSYAAGNAVLDAVAARRRAQGGRAITINWGPWSEVGLAAAQSVRGKQLASRGISSLPPEKALDAFMQIIAAPPVQVAVVDGDWAAYRAATSAPTRILDGVSAPKPKEAPSIRTSARSLIMATDPGSARRAAIEGFLKQQVARVLRQSVNRIDATKPFRNLGLDSLMGLEFRNRLEAELSLSLPATLVWNFPTVQTLATHLATLLDEPREAVIKDASSEPVVDDEIDALLREIEKLPVDEARRLLAAADLDERGP